MNFHGEKRSNDTHQSTTDPEAKLARKKGKESKMSYSAHGLMENRNGLIVDRVEDANGYAERRTAMAVLKGNVVKTRRTTVGADAGFETSAGCYRPRPRTNEWAGARHPSSPPRVVQWMLELVF